MESWKHLIKYNIVYRVKNYLRKKQLNNIILILIYFYLKKLLFNKFFNHTKIDVELNIVLCVPNTINIKHTNFLRKVKNANL